MQRKSQRTVTVLVPQRPAHHRDHPRSCDDSPHYRRSTNLAISMCSDSAPHDISSYIALYPASR